MPPIPLFQLNPEIDRSKAAHEFERDGRTQIGDVLTTEAATTLAGIIRTRTPWSIACYAGEEKPQSISNTHWNNLSPENRNAIYHKVGKTVQRGQYGFLYAHYPLLEAFREQRDPGGPHDILLEHINDQPFLNLVRDVTSIFDLVKADAQATLFGPNHFLGKHDDRHVAENRKIAYVLNLCGQDWQPEWGGYLLFYDVNGDVVAGFKPRFNSLTLFRVPQLHSVTFVPPFAPVARYAVTGWLRT